MNRIRKTARNAFLGVLLLSLAMFLAPPSSYADTIYLKNGGKLEGKVTEEGDKVTIETKWGPITVPKTSVVKIVREGEREEDGLKFPPSGEKRGKAPSRSEEKADKKPEEKSPKDVLKALVKSVTAGEISDHVRYLASPKLEGRGTGTNGGKLAAKYIAKEFKKYGLKPGGDGGSYLQEFGARGGTSWNVVGYLKGGDRAAAEQVVVVGGHYDHIGKRGGSYCPGADDNASGTAGILEIADAFTEGKLPHSRTIVFICFGGEEVGLVGSRKYVQNPAFPISNTVAMINLDMISRNSPDQVVVYNAGSEWDAVLEEANKHGRFKINRSRINASDHASFQRAGVPVAFFCTGMHGDLHKPGDTPDKCDFKKAERIAETVCLVALALCDKKGRFAATSKEEMEKQLGGRLGVLAAVAEIPRKARDRYKIPEEDHGVVVEKVIEDSPADKAKLKEEDIIISFNDRVFPAEGTLLEYEKAVNEAPGGKRLECVVLRKGIRKKLRVKLPEE